MHYAISVFHQDGEKRAKLTLVTPKYEFALVLPYSDLRTSEGRELIWAWVAGIFTIPVDLLELQEWIGCLRAWIKAAQSPNNEHKEE